jgi:hypothetical protein
MNQDRETPSSKLSARLWRHESHVALNSLRNHTLHEIETGAVDDLLDAAEAPAGASMRSRHHTPIVGHAKGKTDATELGRPDVRTMRFWKRRAA